MGAGRQAAVVRRPDDRLAAREPQLGLERAIALVALHPGLVRRGPGDAAAHAVAVLVQPQRAAVAADTLDDRARERLADRVGRRGVRELAREVEQHLGARALLGRLLVQDGVLERESGDVRHDLEQAHVVAVEAGLAVAGQHDGADGRVLTDERRGQQRHAGRVHEQRLTAAHDLERLRPQFGERAALARARGGDRRLAQLLAGQRPDGRAVVRQRLAQHAQQCTGDVGGPLRRRERARERLQMAHLLERAPGARRHRRRAASDQALVGERDAVLAEPLGLVQRGVGRLQQVAQIGAVARPARDPERERQPPAAQVDGREAALEAAADGARVGLRRLGEQQRELLAADPEHAVGRAHAAAQQHAHLAQRVVARDMAARVVELLEVVDVGEHEREAGRARRHQAAHRLVEAAVVGETRERVRGGLELLALEGAQALERHRGMRDQERGVVDHLGRQRPACRRSR